MHCTYIMNNKNHSDTICQLPRTFCRCLALALPAILRPQPPRLRRKQPPPATNTFVVRYPPVASRSLSRRHAALSVMVGQARQVLTPATCLGPERDCSNNAVTAGVPMSPTRQSGSYGRTIKLTLPCRSTLPNIGLWASTLPPHLFHLSSFPWTFRLG